MTEYFLHELNPAEILWKLSDIIAFNISSLVLEENRDNSMSFYMNKDEHNPLHLQLESTDNFYTVKDETLKLTKLLQTLSIASKTPANVAQLFETMHRSIGIFPGK